jgi:hypothetical protein
MTRCVLTAGEIAERIQQEGEDVRAISERLRHWTKEGLLKPLGKKNPGTGRRHRYPERALVDAAILSRLTQKYGLWAKKMPLFTTALLDKAVEQIPKMRGHLENKRIVYLVCASIDGKFLANVQQVAEPGVLNPPPEDRLTLSPSMDDAIVINLNRLFARLGVPLEKEKGRG